MEGLVGAVGEFLTAVLAELAELGLEHAVVGAEIDHICYRVETIEQVIASTFACNVLLMPPL